VHRLEVALDEVALVLGVERRPARSLAGELLDCVERLPQREHHELGAIVDVATQHPDAAVAGRGRVRRTPVRRIVLA
jgi:hypothetical protein